MTTYSFISLGTWTGNDPSGQLLVEFAVRSIAEQIWIENLADFLSRAGCERDPEVRAVWITYAGMAITFLAVLASKGGGGYDSFSSFKNANGLAGINKQWHHIVPQYNPNVVRFGSQRIHNVQNLVAIPEQVHRRITAFYNSKPFFTRGKYLYE